MSKNNSKYIFKYNKEDELYNYVELNTNNKVISYFMIENSTLIRYDKKSDTKNLIKFKHPIKLKQKFMLGESFITVFSSKTDECIQYNMPDKEREIVLVKNNVSLSDFGRFVVNHWKKNNKIEIKSTENSNISTARVGPITNSFLKNIRGFNI